MPHPASSGAPTTTGSSPKRWPDLPLRGVRHAERLNANQPVIHGLSVFETAERPIGCAAYHARGPGPFNGSVARQRGLEQQFARDETANRVDFAQMALARTPVRRISAREIDASHDDLRGVRDYVRRLGASGFNVAEQEVNLYRKLRFRS